MDQLTMYARYQYLALRRARNNLSDQLEAEFKQLQVSLDADTLVAQPDPIVAAVKRAMTNGTCGKLGADPLDRIAIVEKRRAALSDPTIEYGRKWSQYHHALQAAYEGGDLVPKPRRKLASAGQVFTRPDQPHRPLEEYRVEADVYDDMENIGQYFTPMGVADNLTEYMRWPEWLVAQIEASTFDPKANRVITRLLRPHELAILKAGKAWVFLDSYGRWIDIVRPEWNDNAVYRTV